MRSSASASRRSLGGKDLDAKIPPAFSEPLPSSSFGASPSAATRRGPILYGPFAAAEGDAPNDDDGSGSEKAGGIFASRSLPPKDRRLAEAEERIGVCKGNAVVSVDSLGQGELFERGLDHRKVVSFQQV